MLWNLLYVLGLLWIYKALKFEDLEVSFIVSCSILGSWCCCFEMYMCLIGITWVLEAWKFKKFTSLSYFPHFSFRWWISFICLNPFLAWMLQVPKKLCIIFFHLCQLVKYVGREGNGLSFSLCLWPYYLGSWTFIIT